MTKQTNKQTNTTTTNNASNTIQLCWSLEAYRNKHYHTFSNRTHFRARGQFWLSSVQRARSVADEKG